MIDPQTGAGVRRTEPPVDTSIFNRAFAAIVAQQRPVPPGAAPVPGIFVIGAMKSGTTTLCADLATHPQILLTHVKESQALVRSGGHTSRALDAYREITKEVECEGRLLLDGSTDYTKFPHRPCVAELARKVAPNAHVIYVVRDPIRRAISHSRHQRAWGVASDPDLDTALLTDPIYVDCGRYWMQLEPWIHAFGDHRITVLAFEDYVADRRAVVSDTVARLGLDPSRLAVDEQRVLNDSRSAKQVPTVWRRVLRSDAYRMLARGRVRPVVRHRLMNLLLRDANTQKPVGERAARWIAEQCSDDALALASFMGRTAPLWDLEATLGSVVAD